jgi:hypothetical protein
LARKTRIVDRERKLDFPGSTRGEALVRLVLETQRAKRVAKTLAGVFARRLSSLDRVSHCGTTHLSIQSEMADASADRGGVTVTGTESVRFEALIAHLTPEQQAEIRPKFAGINRAAQELFLDKMEYIIGPYENPLLDAPIPGSFTDFVQGITPPLFEAMDVIFLEHLKKRDNTSLGIKWAVDGTRWATTVQSTESRPDPQSSARGGMTYDKSRKMFRKL